MKATQTADVIASPDEIGGGEMSAARWANNRDPPATAATIAAKTAADRARPPARAASGSIVNGKRSPAASHIRMSPAPACMAYSENTALRAAR